MNFRILSLLLIVSMSPVAASSASADPKPWIFSWSRSHWDGLDFRPYAHDNKHNHKRQWDYERDNDGWTPESWISQYRDPMDVIRGFYNADIIRHQVMDREHPVLVVGPNFYRLSSRDQRRVTQTIDRVYEATEFEPYRFALIDYYENDIIGYYDRNGLFME